MHYSVPDLQEALNKYIFIQWFSNLLYANHCQGTWKVIRDKRNMSQNKDNTIFTKHYTYNRTQNWGGNLFDEFLVTQKKNITFKTFISPQMVSQSTSFNESCKSGLLIACSFHRISERANQIIFLSSFYCIISWSRLSLSPLKHPYLDLGDFHSPVFLYTSVHLYTSLNNVCYCFMYYNILCK